MNFFCISDNIDTKIGMRLAGIEGTIAHTSEELDKALDQACSNKDIGIVLISSKLMKLSPKRIYEFKLRVKYPLIVEIPDRHGQTNISDSITNYVREAIGVKI